MSEWNKRDTPHYNYRLQAYNVEVYSDINTKIDQISNMIPAELDNPTPKKEKKRLVDGLGKFFKYIVGVATTSDLENYSRDWGI